MEMQKTNSIESNEIFLFHKVSSELAPILSKLEEWGYLLVETAGKDWPAVSAPSGIERPRVFLIDLSGHCKIEEILSAQENLMKNGIQATYLGVYAGKMKFSWHQAYQLGLQGVFQIPLDEENFLSRLFELVPHNLDLKKLGIDALVKVNLTRLDREESLPFDVFVYLPANRRVVLFRKKGTALESSVRERFNKNQHWNIYIHKSDLSTYQADLGANILSASKEIALNNEVLRDVMQGFFSESDFAESEAEQLKQNIYAAIDFELKKSPSDLAIWSRAQSICSSKMTYMSHSKNVASYCGVFGRALGFEDLASLITAGLLHDLGLSELPTELIWKPESSFNDEERSQYRLHSGFAKHSLEKVKGFEKISEYILYHHERLDGSGYPYGLTSDKIPLGAKILALADEFDKMTSLRPGFPQWTPREAMVRLAGLEGFQKDPVFDSQLFEPLLKLFIEPKAVEGKASVADGKQLSLKQWLAKNPKPPSNVSLASHPSIVNFEKQLQEHFARALKSEKAI